MYSLSIVCLVFSDKVRSTGTKIPKCKKYLTRYTKEATTKFATTYQQTVGKAFSGMIRDEVFLLITAGTYSLEY